MSTLPIASFADPPLASADELREQVAALRALRRALRDAYPVFGGPPLSLSDRNTLSPLIVPQAQLFVQTLARAVSLRPHLFRHLPLDPETLALQQQVADALRAVRCHLQELERRCGDAFLRAQSAAVCAARRTVVRVQQEAELFDHDDPQVEDRQLALRLPASFLVKRQSPRPRSRRTGGTR